MENNRTNFWIWNNYFWKVPILHIIQNHWKNQLYYELLSFNLTVKYIRLYNFRLWRILWTRNAYRLIVWKVFLFQILGETSIFTLPGKVPLWQKNVKMMFCVAIWICMSPRTYWNLNMLCNDCLDSCWSIVVKKWNDIPPQTGLSNLLFIETHHIF